MRLSLFIEPTPPMKNPISLLLLSLFFLIEAWGQKNQLLPPQAFVFLEQAGRFFCQGDSHQTMQALAQAQLNLASDKRFEPKLNLSLAQFYASQGKTEQAIELLLQNLEAQANAYHHLADLNQACGLYEDWFKLDAVLIKVESYRLLSKCYQTQVGGDSLALVYLQQADKSYFSTSGCMNETINHKTKLALDFADYFLQRGDSTEALHALLAYFLSGESYDKLVTARLKELLRQQYSPEEINQDFNQALAKMSLKLGPNGTWVSRIELWSYVLERPSSGHIEADQKAYQKQANVLFLLSP